MSLSAPAYFILGLSLFLYGMFSMSRSLKNIAGIRLKIYIRHMTNTLPRSFLTGMWITALMQSSSAVTVMAVGFVNAGVLELQQVLGIIMGANIGTTITAQLLRLDPSIGSCMILRFFRPTFFAYILIPTAIILYLFCKKTHTKQIAAFLIGLAMLFIGMHTMELAAAPLQSSARLKDLFLHAANPIYGIGIGALATAIMQSSSASIGILQAISTTGILPWSAAVPILMGQNIGTSITAIIASIGTNIHARRTALLHLYFNLLGTFIFFSAFYILHISFFPWNDPIGKGGIANFHTLFNSITALFLLPFSNFLLHLVILSIPERKHKQSITIK